MTKIMNVRMPLSESVWVAMFSCKINRPGNPGSDFGERQHVFCFIPQTTRSQDELVFRAPTAHFEATAIRDNCTRRKWSVILIEGGEHRLRRRNDQIRE